MSNAKVTTLAPFYLTVEGARGPKKPHGTLESAREEARRLYTQHKTARRVYLLGTLETIEPVETDGDSVP